MFQRPGEIVAGKYRLEKPLARGGVGTVWVARHTQLGHHVAVKFIDPKVASSPQVRMRFEREGRAAAQLRSPNIVQVSDYGVQGETPYLVMELLHGETLHARLRKVKRLSLAEANRILVQIGRGLKRAHEVGFIHRDLKPANIFLCRHDDDEEETVKILDFGIAKETGADIGESTKTGELVGSPHFMSPEQIRGEREVDARSDLWALGVILFKALTGELPFPGEVLTAVITKIVIDPVPSVLTYLPDAPPQLDAFFSKALCRDRTQRFQNVREMVAAFGALATGGSAVAAAEPSAGSPAFAQAANANTPSVFPSAGPGASLSGSMPGTPVPGTPLPGSMPGTPVPGTPLPGSMPGTPVPAQMAVAPHFSGMPSFPPAASPSTLTAAESALPAAQTARRSRFGLWATLGAVALLLTGLLLGALRLRSPEGAATGRPASPQSATPTPFAEPPSASNAQGSDAPTADPATSSTSEPSASALNTARPATPPRTSTSAKTPPASTKKPVDTID